MARGSVLIVEDESLVALALEMMLVDLGYHVAGIVADGARAVEVAGRVQPDLVMMDIVLRGPLDGIEAARRLRADHGLRVVFISGQSDRATRDRADGVEPLGYLPKPYSPDQLKVVMEGALAALKLP